MRTIDTAHEQIYSNIETRTVEVRVRIENGDGTLINVTDYKDINWLLGAECGMDIDSDAATATVKLKRSVYNDSLSPLAKDSRTNLNSLGVWDPFLDLNREIDISVRYKADPSADALDWIELFKGGIDSIDWASDTITLQCRDKFRVLQDTFIEAEAAYSDALGNPLEDILQEILDDILGVGPSPNLLTPVTPGWFITEFKITQQSLADQLLLLTDQIGWRLKYLWDSSSSSFKLTLVEPARGKVTVDRSFTMGEYYAIDKLDADISGIRNAIKVSYPDTADLRNDGTPKLKSVTVTDATSISLYGRRWMGVTEAASSIIDSSTEATTMAEAMLSDLAWPRVNQSVVMPLFAHVELDDLYTFAANDVHYSYDPTFAVVAFRHTISEGKAYTSLQLREDVPAGRNLSWFHLAGVNGLNKKPRDDSADIANVRVVENTLGMTVAWDVNLTGFDRYQEGALLKDTFYEVHVTPSGGTPSTSTLVGITKSTSFFIPTDSNNLVPVGEALDIHVRAISKAAESAYATVTNARPQPVGTAGFDPNSAPFVDGFSTNFNEQTRGTDHGPDFWEIETGTWNTDLALDDGTAYSGATPRYGAKHLLLK